MSPRPKRAGAADTATRLVEAAARLLAEEGEHAVTARRVTAEAGMSTMAVYTHFGSMDELIAEVWREGFARFGAALDAPSLTSDAVADFMAQGWSYRAFARREPDLYRVMFGKGLVAFKTGREEDAEAAMSTFGMLLGRIERCREAGRFRIDDSFLAGEVVWCSVHGHTLIELLGYHTAVDRDPEQSFAEVMLRLAVGFGDDLAAARRSLTASRRRARRAGDLG